MLGFCITCFVIACILLVGLVVYYYCVAAGRADRAINSFTATEEKQKKIERGKITKPHDCHFVKHYDTKRECYVNRCTICNKVEFRFKKRY